MALFDEDIDRAFAELIKQWNIAEQRIKKAEQVRGNEVVASAIFELRYAGRKIIDAVEISMANNVLIASPERDRVLAYIADATEDCVKAKHDAIDAMLDFVTRWFFELESAISLGRMQQYFPNYLSTSSLIATVQDKIADSRQHRTTSRDDMYDEIERDSFDKILSVYNEIRLSQNRVLAEIKREQRHSRIWTSIHTFTFGVAIMEACYIIWNIISKAAH